MKNRRLAKIEDVNNLMGRKNVREVTKNIALGCPTLIQAIYYIFLRKNTTLKIFMYIDVHICIYIQILGGGQLFR